MLKEQLSLFCKYKLKKNIMKSDPKECLYCQNNETLHNLMIEIAQLSVSRVFLFKEQTYRRCGPRDSRYAESV